MKKIFSYQSVANSLYNDFILDKLEMGDAIPTEQELINYYKVSRTTIRRSIKKLAKANIIYTVQGSGSFVKGKKEESLGSGLLGFCGCAKQLGVTSSSKILGFEIIPASKEIAKKLDIEEGSPVYHTKRLRYLGDIPKQVEVSFLPMELFTDFSVDVLLGSKYQYIEQKKKMIIKNSHMVLEPIILDPATAQLLETKPYIAACRIKSIGFLNDDTAFEYTEIIENSSRYNLSFNIRRQR